MVRTWYLVDEHGAEYPLPNRADGETLRKVIAQIPADGEDWVDFTPVGAEFPVHVHLNERCGVIER